MVPSVTDEISRRDDSSLLSLDEVDHDEEELAMQSLSFAMRASARIGSNDEDALEQATTKKAILKVRRQSQSLRVSTSSVSAAEESSLSATTTSTASTISSLEPETTDEEGSHHRVPSSTGLSSLSSSISSSLSASLRSNASSAKSVAFDSVEVRHYPITLGCNPAVSQGPPLTIDWDATHRSTHTVEDFEEARPPKRSSLLLKTTKTDRERLLKGQGFDSRDFELVAAAVAEIQKSRESSAKDSTSNLGTLMAESRQKKMMLQKRPSKLSLRSLFPKRRSSSLVGGKKEEDSKRNSSSSRSRRSSSKLFSAAARQVEKDDDGDGETMV